jgi:hypothetical protein
MATKYCDHGAYGAASFTGYICSVNGAYNGAAGYYLTVTACTGVLSVGSKITGSGVPANTYISGFVSGTHGGVGCYTLMTSATNANVALSSRSMTGEFASVLSAPLAFGTAQEGDGLASTPAVSATVSIDCTSYVFTSGSSTFSVMGCTALTVGAGANSATNAQYNATLTTMIDNMVSCINQATATIVNKPAGWRTPQVRDAVFARRNGNNLELMTRCGSASWNTLTAVTFTNVTNATSATWSGGVSGCWGHILNMSRGTYWPSAYAVCSYGIWGSTLPNAGTLAAGDVIYIRSNKHIPVAFPANNFIIPMSVTLGAYNNPVVFNIDDSTVWADGANPVLNIYSCDAYSTNLFTNTSGSNHFSEINGVTYSDGTRSLKFSSFINGNYPLNIQVTFGLTVRNADFISLNGSSPTGVSLGYNGSTPNSAQLTRFDNCRFVSRAATAAMVYTATSILPAEFRNCVFEVDTSVVSVPHPGIIGLVGNTMAEIVFECCKFVGFTSPSRLFTLASIGGWVYHNNVVLRDCDYGSVTNRGPIHGQTAVNKNSVSEYAHSTISTSVLGSCDWFVDNQFGFAAWTQLRYPPTCYAKQENGTDGWAVEVIPATVAGLIAWNAPFKAPRFYKKNTLADGDRTFTIQLAIDSTLSFTKKDVSLVIQYVAVDGSLVLVESFDLAGGALDAGTGTWSAESGGQVVFAANGTTLNKKQIQLSTVSGKPLKTGTRVAATVCFHTMVTNTSQVCLVDPEVVIA